MTKKSKQVLKDKLTEANKDLEKAKADLKEEIQRSQEYRNQEH